MRSHDQFNTTIYGMDDRYRGVRGRRDVVFVNAADLAALGLAAGDAVVLVAPRRGGGERRYGPLVAVEYAISRGSCAAYYPEAMPLVALEDHDPVSHTPAYKSVVVSLTPSA